MNATSRDYLRNIALLFCALTASWPLTVLIHGTSVEPPAILSITLVVMSGALCRRFHFNGILTLLVQALVFVTALMSTLALRGISAIPSNWPNLAADVNKTVHTWTAPLPATAGVTTMILTAAIFIALVVDFVGGTARMPLFAAIPIAAPFVLGAAALGHLLPAHFFGAAALAWAVLVFTSTPIGLARLRQTWLNASAFAALSAIAVAAAVCLAPHIPHRPTPALGQRSGGGIDTSVDFSRSLDLRKDLHSQNSAPILQYDTTAAYPAPLRVTTSSDYENGVWKANALNASATEVKPQTALLIPGLDASTSIVSTHTSVTLNGLKAPFVAAPVPLHAANFGPANGSFRLVTASGIPLVSHKPDSYAVLSYSFTADAHPSNDAASGTSAPSVTNADLDTSQLPDSTLKLIRELSRVSDTEAATPFDKAVAIQRYLRIGGHFTYSLTVASAQVGNVNRDPLATFLTSKKGYCTQFATAMIMAARLDGIPARMAIGFLPGTKKAGHYQVRASDAHAWPELYFPGMGWTRFDPTPPGRSGSAPAYAPDSPSSRSGKATSSPRPSSTSATPRNSTSPTTSPTHPMTTTRHGHGFGYWLTILGALFAVGLAASALPIAGRRERSRLLRRATTNDEYREGQWHEARWCLKDLGLPLVSGRSPQDTLASLRNEHPLRSSALDDALTRTFDVIERARYSNSPPSQQETDMVMRRLVTTARQEAGAYARLRAALIPRSGREFLQRKLHRK